MAYLWIGEVRPSLYHITKVTLSSATGGVTLHGKRAVPPCTASMNVIGAVCMKTNRDNKKQNRNYSQLFQNLFL